MRTFIVITIICVSLLLYSPPVSADDFSGLGYWYHRWYNTNNIHDTQTLSSVVNCTTDADCNYRGRCSVLTSDCVCDRGYLTFNCEIGEGCCYVQKQQLTAFCLSFFVGVVGADRFYLGHDAVGAGKLVYFLGTPCVLCILAIILELNGVDGHMWGLLFRFFWVLGGMVFWLHDVISIGLNNMNDHNHAPLSSW